MKYIVLNSFTIFLFPPQIGHAEFLERVKESSGDRCTGAGFVSKDWRCVGESVSLGIGRGPTDEKLLEIALQKAPGGPA